ncbi:MAG: recombinase family protein [Defluviitaleaceae bacterium]|nr:recombinase family protein [Defluviitaleaceae bacterium]
MTQEAKKWCPAIYARLSNEDVENKKKGVSVSIAHQLDILKGFVKEKGWQSPKVFYDDDRTGTNFDRKGFQDMYSAAKNGEINVIVIKDTSRFGRNWVQSGVYFESIEEMGIRFISIQENLDTADPQCPALKMLPFYFIFNEWHSQTTSEKIRAVFSKQNEQGVYRACQSPYGYEKDPNNRHRLVIDPFSASVVRRIFEMRLQKMSYGSIATILNNEGLSSPSGYNAEKYGIENKKTRINKWSINSVLGIVNNPVYCGDVAHNKHKSVSYKQQKAIRQPFEKWNISRDMHEPIVSRENWQKCFDMKETLGRIRKAKDGDVSTFTGLLVCSSCDYKLGKFNSWYKLRSGEKKFRFPTIAVFTQQRAKPLARHTTSRKKTSTQ